MTKPAQGLNLADGLSLRMARKSDEPFLMEMFMAARPWFQWAEGGPEFIRHLYEDQYRINRQGMEHVYPEHADFIVEKAGQDVGRLTLDMGYSNWHITILELHPQARGKGIGRSLVGSLQRIATEARTVLTVSTLAELKPALRFYAAMGFAVADRQGPAVHLSWVPVAMRQPVPQA